MILCGLRSAICQHRSVLRGFFGARNLFRFTVPTFFSANTSRPSSRVIAEAEFIGNVPKFGGEAVWFPARLWVENKPQPLHERTQTMQQLICLELSATTSESRFTLDELVLKVRELSAEQGMAQVVALILHLVDELPAMRQTSGQATPARVCACGHTRYELKDRLGRQLHTSVGTVAFRRRRLACRHCNKTWCPLRELLGLKLWQSKSAELERIAVEVVSEQSYRRGSRHLAVAGKIPVTKQDERCGWKRVNWKSEARNQKSERKPNSEAAIVMSSFAENSRR